MACLNAVLIARNSPFFPVSVIPRPEIPRPPYIGGKGSGKFSGRLPMIDLFGLKQQPKRIHDKPEAAALVEVTTALDALCGSTASQP